MFGKKSCSANLWGHDTLPHLDPPVSTPPAQIWRRHAPLHYPIPAIGLKYGGGGNFKNVSQLGTYKLQVPLGTSLRPRRTCKMVGFF